jgi:PAN domain
MDRVPVGVSERSRMRRCWLYFGLWFALILPWAPAQAQVGFDRPGGDYASFPMRSADPAQCAARCERDGRCRAWAFSYPATESASAVCWLKSKVNRRVAAPCCVSGVRGAGVIEPRTGVVEFGFDRFGGDYRHFDTAMDANGKSCQLACEAEGGCRAWTYVRPGYIGTAAVCYLKNRITRPVRKPCCISGVVR